MLAFIEIYLLSARQYANCYHYIPYLIWSSQQLREGDIKKTQAYWVKQLAQVISPPLSVYSYFYPTSLSSLCYRQGSALFFKVQLVHFARNPIPSYLPKDFFHVTTLFPSARSFLSEYKHNVESPTSNSLCPNITFQLLPISHFSSYSASQKTPTHSAVSPVLSQSLVIFILPNPWTFLIFNSQQCWTQISRPYFLKLPSFSSQDTLLF